MDFKALEQLRAEWHAAYKAVSGPDPAGSDYQREQDAWDALVEYVEAHGLTGTADDPRTGRQSLHIGANAEGLRLALPELQAVADVPEISGDGWESWGEPVGEDANDLETLHVVFPLRPEVSPEELDGILEGLHTSGLVYMREGHQRGTYAVLTDAEDWSVVYHTWTEEEGEGRTD